MMIRDNVLIGIAEGALPKADLDRFLIDERAGAICTFAGTARRWTGPRETTQLEYEAYEEMAERLLEELAFSAAARWDLLKVGLLHRVGIVPLGEASVLVGVAGRHRAEAFEACRWLIDTLKTEVPIWKREVYADGGSEWIDGTETGLSHPRTHGSADP